MRRSTRLHVDAPSPGSNRTSRMLSDSLHTVPTTRGGGDRRHYKEESDSDKEETTRRAISRLKGRIIADESEVDDEDSSSRRRSSRLSGVTSASRSESRGSLDVDDDEEQNFTRTTGNGRRGSLRGHVSVTQASYGARTSSRGQLNGRGRSGYRQGHHQQVEEEQDEEDDDDDDDDEEPEEDEFGQRKHSARERRPRQIDNVKTLGGDGGGLSKSNQSSRGFERDLRDLDQRPIYKEPRLYLGGRLPNGDSKRPRHHHRRRKEFRRHFDSSSESDNSDASRGSPMSQVDEDEQFRRHEQKRLHMERESVQPLNLAGGMGGSVRDRLTDKDMLRADATPVGVDPKIGFQSIGGLDSHIRSLKEMVVLPLLYPDVFERFDTQPPRGVLFVGPPGTGKTLTARALANSVSCGSLQGSKKVSFFMRKGADCLSKWVGEGERQLRLLFEQAKRYQPSIIFFDEIDGLAPVRSVKQDQIHASIVSTLLALMDGLDSRGQVVVIGATNRPDAIDPALRRPGRFDRELAFPLPDALARTSILDIHTASWDPPLASETKQWIVSQTVGYCGADMKALCAEAALVSLRRAYPQVYTSNVRLTLDHSTLQISKGDFAAALNKVVPSSRRESYSPAKPLDPLLLPLLKDKVDSAVAITCAMFPPARDSVNKMAEAAVDGQIKEDSESWVASLTDVHDNTLLSKYVPSAAQLPVSSLQSEESFVNKSLWDYGSVTAMARLMISGKRDMGQREVASALLQHLEAFTVHNLDLPALVADPNSHTTEQALVHRIQLAFKQSPSVIYIPDVVGWWQSATESMRTILVSMIESVPMNLPVFWLTTLTDMESIASDSSDDNRLMKLIDWLRGKQLHSSRDTSGANEIILQSPSLTSKQRLFHTFVEALPLLPARIYAARKKILLSKAVTLQPSNDQLSAAAPEQTTEQIDQEKDKNCLRELRNFFRTVLHVLYKEKRFAVFCKPVDPEAVPDYYDIISYPMDLETIRMKIDEQLYPTYASFYRDFERILFNAKEYNPILGKDARGKNIVHAAHSMVDHIESHSYSFKKKLGYDLFKKCDAIARRAGIPELPSPKEGDKMPETDLKFYRMIFERHREMKEANGEEYFVPQPAPVEAHDVVTSSLAVGTSPLRGRRSTRRTGDVEVNFEASPPKVRAAKKRSLEETLEEADGAVDVEPSMSENEEKNEIIEDSIDKAIYETFLVEVAPEEAIDAQPLMVALLKSIEEAAQHSERRKLDALQERLVQHSAWWTVPELVSLMTTLNRTSRSFQQHGNWARMMKELDAVVKAVTEQFAL